MISVSLTSYSQFKLNGKVVNINNDLALAGSSIKIEELNLGATSNTDGSYQINEIKPGNYTLVVSHIGFKTYQTKINIQKNTFKNIRLTPITIDLNTTVITATRTRLDKNNVPAKTEIITQEQIADHPATSFDDLLRTLPNVVVNRSWGMFSKNSSVTMRGMNASARTLILLNGSPLNKTAGGTIVWDMINPESVERVEVIKGPGSAVYGNNAMGGVINIITKTPPNEKIKGSISGFTGSYGIRGSNLSLGQRKNFGKTAWFWQLHSNYTKGDGYINEPDESRSEINVPVYVEEASLNIKSGLVFNPNQNLTFEYAYYNGRHGGGTKLDPETLPSGSFDHYHTNLLSAKYQANFKGYLVDVIFFNHWQDVDGATEKINKKGIKTINREFSDTRDYGIFINLSKQFKAHRILAGIDLKNGNLEGLEKSLINADHSDFEGQMQFSGFFLQDEINIANNKLKAILGFRIDHAKFSKGLMKLNDEALITSEDNTWNQFSPRVSLLWEVTHKSILYSSFTTGFMPPKLDDLVRTGLVTKGYKLANPNLKPEKNTSLEFGGRFNLSDKIHFEPAVYYSWLDDMVYFIETGEEIKIGNKKQPVLQKQNISKAEIYGFENSLTYDFSINLKFSAAYTYNHSTIKEFYDENTAQDFEGKYLIEVPKHQFSFSSYWKNKIVNVSAIYNFMDRQWFDDINTEFIESYHTIDLKFSKSITKNFGAYLTIQNLLDDAFIGRKGLLSPGRFVLLELKYKI